MLGQTVGHYHILEELGKGGMGIVYMARDTHLDRLVAIKVLPPDAISSQERQRSFVKEAKAASALNHPNIITIYDISSWQGTDFIVMELVDGKTLYQLIREGLKLKEALRYAVQICDALDKAHTAGIVHLDLKPSNVMVTGDGLVKVLDFGLAKLTEHIDNTELTVTETISGADKPRTEEGKVVGTAGYMSPEQVEGKKLDARSDIFSFGAMLYEMVTGQKAFQKHSKLATLEAVLREGPAPIRTTQDVSPELHAIMERCLQKERSRRFQHVDDVKVMLEEVRENVDSTFIGTGKSQADALARKKRLALRWAPAALAILLAGVAGYWPFRSRLESPQVILKAVPLTTYPGFEMEPSFAPDGNQVAFSWNGPKEDNFDIYVKLVGPGEPLRLTTNPELDASPAWSPDGLSIAFVRRLSAERAGVFLLPALGGQERKLTEIYSPFIYVAASSNFSLFPGPYVAWTPDSQQLVVIDKPEPKESVALFLVSLATGKRRRLTSPPPGIMGDSGPAISPDGSALLFVRHRNFFLSDVYRLNLFQNLQPRGDPVVLPTGALWNFAPCWTPDGRQIVLSAGVAGATGLLRVGREGTNPQRLPIGGEFAMNPTLSRRGQRLVFATMVWDTNLWELSIPRPGERAGAAVQLTTSTRGDYAPHYSPDGRKIAFVTTRSGATEIWVSNRDGSNAAQLTTFGGAHTNIPKWSPDGRQIAFNSNVTGQAEIYVINAEGGELRQLTNHAGQNFEPAWSHDGRWIYFTSNRSGASQVWKMPISGGEAVQVTQNGGNESQESPDSKFLYYAKGLDGFSLWRLPLDGGHEMQILPLLSFPGNYAVTVEGIYFIPPSEPEAISTLRFLSFATSQITTVTRIPKPVHTGLTVSPDNHSVVYTQIDLRGSDLMFVANVW